MHIVTLVKRNKIGMMIIPFEFATLRTPVAVYLPKSNPSLYSHHYPFGVRARN
jgi:hypothetical protein